MAASALLALVAAAGLRYQFVQQAGDGASAGAVSVTHHGWTLADPARSPRAHHFGVVRAQVQNDSSDKVAVRLEILDGAGRPLATRLVELAGGASRVVMIPVAPGGGSGYLVISAPGAPSVPLAILARPRKVPRVLALGSEQRFEDVTGMRPDYAGGDLEVETLSPAALPSELAALAGYEVVALLDAPFEALPEPSRRLLENYAATGGALVLARATRASVDHLPLARSGKEGAHPYGWGNVRFCYQDSERCGAGMAADAAGAGPAVFAAGRAADAPATLLPMRGLPVGSFVAVVAIFALAVGPGSLWVARRVHLAAVMVTIPATAFVTSVALVGFSVLRDGIGMRAASCSHTLLDRSGNRAIQATVAGLFGPFRASGGRLDLATTLFFGYVPSPRTLRIDWDRGAALGEDFAPARTYREWGFLTVAPSRARLVVKEEPAGLLVQNALGGAIREARIRHGGLLWGVDRLADGGAGYARAATAGASWSDPACASRLAGPGPEPLREGEFVAMMAEPGSLPLSGFDPAVESGEQLVRGEVTR